jgi:asparaginyl-tRNA synthetase
MQAPVTTISQLGSHEGQSVTIRGWLYNLRESGKLLFPIIRDGSGLVQGVVVKSKVAPELWNALKGLTQESALIVSGQVRADKRAPGGYELEVETAEVVQRVAEGDPYPITLKEHGVDFLMEHRHLWMRSPRQAAILRTRAEIINSAREYLNQNGYTLTDPPILTPAACEGTTTLFPVDYFEEQAYLTQSGQLYMEATAMALGKVYSFGPTFRAEKSKTRRHLTEFWMVEPEVAFNDSDDNMRLQEEFISAIVARVLDRRAGELKELERDTSRLASVVPPFPRVSYTEAVERLKAKGSSITWGQDLGAEDETGITEGADRPVFVYNYPRAAKAFYMKENPADPRTVLCDDCLAPEGYGEIIGGSQREDDHDRLLARIREQGLPAEAYGWYLDLRKYGTFVHSGFGLGVERTVAWITGTQHIRETIAFPRMIYRLTP